MARRRKLRVRNSGRGVVEGTGSWLRIYKGGVVIVLADRRKNSGGLSGASPWSRRNGSSKAAATFDGRVGPSRKKMLHEAEYGHAGDRNLGSSKVISNLSNGDATRSRADQRHKSVTLVRRGNILAMGTYCPFKKVCGRNRGSRRDRKHRTISGRGGVRLMGKITGVLEIGRTTATTRRSRTEQEV